MKTAEDYYKDYNNDAWDLYHLEEELKRCEGIDYFTNGKHPSYKLRIEALERRIKEIKDKA